MSSLSTRTSGEIVEVQEGLMYQEPYEGKLSRTVSKGGIGEQIEVSTQPKTKN